MRTSLLIAVVLGMPFTNGLSDEAPLETQNRPDVPSLLAQIVELEQSLKTTEVELTNTRHRLSASETELSSTQANLEETLSRLQLMEAESEITAKELHVTVESLEQGRNCDRVSATNQDLAKWEKWERDTRRFGRRTPPSPFHDF